MNSHRLVSKLILIQPRSTILDFHHHAGIDSLVRYALLLRNKLPRHLRPEQPFRPFAATAATFAARSSFKVCLPHFKTSDHLSVAIVQPRRDESLVSKRLKVGKQPSGNNACNTSRSPPMAGWSGLVGRKLSRRIGELRRLSSDGLRKTESERYRL